MRLSDAAGGRDNNFNLVRLCAASAVLIAHGFVLATGDLNAEPSERWLGVSIATVAVDAFFVTSGFLVTASLERTRSPSQFLLGRILRIYPALLVMLALVVVVMAPAVTTLELADYLSRRQTLKFFLKNAVLLFGVEHYLPGVFLDNPYRGAVNGSLWTMPWELRMYLLLLAIWLVARFCGTIGKQVWPLTIAAIALGTGLVHLSGVVAGQTAEPAFRFCYFFFVGAAFSVFKGRIVLSNKAAAACLAALALAAFDRSVFFPVYGATFAYLLMWLAFVPAGPVREFNRFGDYSYGVYIYAFPVQQLVVMLEPGISIWRLDAVAGLVTFILAVVSWHLVERRALDLKRTLGPRLALAR